MRELLFLIYFGFMACFVRAFADTAPLLNSDLETAQLFNRSMSELREELQVKYKEASQIADRIADQDVEKGSRDNQFQSLLSDVRDLREKMRSLQERWRQGSVAESVSGDDAYALWDVGEVTVSQLIMEYGATDYLYIIPQELSGMKISLYSSIPLPRESWNEMIEMILVHNGIGVKKINPFSKQLYIMKLDPSAIEAIVSKETDLGLFHPQTRLFFILSPPPEQIKSLQSFFERFSDPKQTTIQAVGSKIVLVASRETAEKLIGLYHAVWEKDKGKIVRLVHLQKIIPAEAEKVLKSFFSDVVSKGRPNFYPGGADELVTLTLPQGLVLIGETETVERGERVLTDLEAQLEDPGEKIIFWYSCKHSNPEDVASVLEKVYDSLIGSNFTASASLPSPPPQPSTPPPLPSPTLSSEPSPAPLYPGQNTIFNPVLPANPPFVQPGTIDKDQKTAFGNFIVDTKTSSILMVVRREELPKIKALLKKMDVPKRMVQLDVLLVEKKLTDRRQVGFNLLQIGTNSSNTKENFVSFDTAEKGMYKGILTYMFSKQSGKFPAVDVRYNFLLAQDDLRINANPSVLAINQTPATVSIVEEISINNGSFPIQTQSGVLIEQSYTRAQYGITIVLTPTIHLNQMEEGDQTGFVTLQTNLEFDTTQISGNDRPPVTRRHIENEVCIADGETVILGGLRRKIEEDSREKIPFLGDLPGIGKLFGATKSTDMNTEMFIFITPKIVKNSIDDLRMIRQQEYQMRPGDVPEFLKIVDDAKNKERRKLFQNSLKMLFDMY